MSSTRQRCSSRQWRTLRDAVIKRDGQCMVTTPHQCTGKLTAGHIVPHALGGADTMDNLQAECSHWNYAQGARLGNAMRNRNKPRQQREW